MITRTSRRCPCHHHQQLQHPFFDVAPYHSCHDRDLLCKEEKLLRECIAQYQSHKSTLAKLLKHVSKASPSQTYQQFRHKHRKPVYFFAVYKELIQESIRQLNLLSENVEHIRKTMNELASTLPEYNTVMHMYGVGPTFGPQLMAEIGDISKFQHREALTAYAGVDPGKNDSGQEVHNSSHASKCGPSRLRHTLFQIMTTMLQNGVKEDDAVSSFLFKKKAENKPYLVYMTAGANKFLRVYYGKVKECLRDQEQAEQ